MKKFTSLGDLIQEYRSLNNLSQADFASEMDVDVRTIIRWEKNVTQLKDELEFKLSDVTFIPHQVIRNLNSHTPIQTFYDFTLRKYALSQISTELPEIDWIRDRMNVFSDRIRAMESVSDLENVIRYNNLQRNPLKTTNKTLLHKSIQVLPDLNLIIVDENGNYAGHCCYLPLKKESYNRIKTKEIKEVELTIDDLVSSISTEEPIYYCHGITADCNENFFYIIGEVFRFFNTECIHTDYVYAILTARYDSYDMNSDLGVKLIWEDFELQKQLNLLAPPRLYEGNFNAFLAKK